MNQIDIDGVVSTPTKPPVTRQSEKADALIQLVRMLDHCPLSVAHGSINHVHAWKAAQAAAKKIAGSSRSTLGDIESAINSMRRFGE